MTAAAAYAPYVLFTSLIGGILFLWMFSAAFPAMSTKGLVIISLSYLAMLLLYTLIALYIFTPVL